MCIISIENFKKFIDAYPTWDFEDYLNMIYRFHNDNYNNDYIETKLYEWRATRGKKVDWDKFHQQRNVIFQNIPNNVNLCGVTEEQIDSIVLKVIELDIFKKTKDPNMVFGSKTAHFFYPHLIPALDSNVRDALSKLESSLSEEIKQKLERVGINKYFPTPQNGSAEKVYKNYFILGNYYLKNFIREVENVIFYIHYRYNFHRIELNARIFECCLLGWYKLQ